MAKLIICVDGLGRDLISKKNTPFLYKFGKENYFSELKTLFAFTGLEYCFFTGKTPDKSGIWFEFVRSNNSIFKNVFLRFFNGKVRNYLGAFLQLLNKRSYICGLHNIPKSKMREFDSSVREGLWRLDYFQKRSFSFYKWPFFIVKNEKAGEGKIIFKYENDDERLKRLLSVKDVDVYYTQLMGVDKVIHKFGKKSEESKVALKKIDKIIEKYVSLFLQESDKNEILIWSDHGFADIGEFIDLFRYLPERKDYLYFIGGTTAHFWFENQEVKKEVLEVVKRIKSVKIINKEQAKKYKIPLDEEYGDLVTYVSKGGYFFPNFYQAKDGERFASMHGYPEDKELNGFLISNKKIPKKLKMNEIIRYIENG